MQYDTVGKLTNSLNILAAETGRPSAGDAVCTYKAIRLLLTKTKT